MEWQETLLVTVLSALAISVLYALGSLYYFISRKKEDEKRIDIPINISLKKIHEENFASEGFCKPPEKRYIVIPKEGIKRYAYNVGSMLVESSPIRPKKYSDFETIVVDDINSIKQIRELVYNDFITFVLPSKIKKNLPEDWVVYLTWKLLADSPPKGYEGVISQKEEKLGISLEDLDVFRTIVNSEKIQNYLSTTYTTQTKKRFDFLKECVYKIAIVVDDKKVFDWIFNNIKKKELTIIQVVIKRYAYQSLLKNKKQVLAYNMTPDFFSVILTLNETIESKTKFHCYSDAKMRFGIILKGFDS